MYTAFLFPVAVATVLAGCHAAPPMGAAGRPAPQAYAARAAAPAAVGDWVMTIHIGDRVFEDHFTIQPAPGGTFQGRLKVIGLWEAPLEKIAIDGQALAFELIAPEKERFRVRYAGSLDAAGRLFTGTATLPEEGGKTMGTFSAIKAAAGRK